MPPSSPAAIASDRDKQKITLGQSDSDVFEIDVLDGDLRRGVGIGHALDQLASLGPEPSEKGIDLVVLAALVNAGDTRVSRKLNAQDGWTREIDLYIPVSTSSAWTASTRSIESMLRFLSGDRWRVFFRDRRSEERRVGKAGGGACSFRWSPCR